MKSNWRIKTCSGNIKNPKGSASSAFKRTEYGLIGNERFFLIHYIGDETVFEPMPHGNVKNPGKNKNFVKTCPSTIDDIKANLETGLTAGKVYNKLKSTVDGQEAVSRAPRNLKQVENIYMSMQRGSVVECLTRDRRVAGSSLTGVTALWSLSKTHLS